MLSFVTTPAWFSPMMGSFRKSKEKGSRRVTHLMGTPVLFYLDIRRRPTTAVCFSRVALIVAIVNVHTYVFSTTLFGGGIQALSFSSVLVLKKKCSWLMSAPVVLTYLFSGSR